MGEVAQWRLEGDVAVLTLDNPPVNAISAAIRAALIDGVKRAGSDPAVRALVIACAGRTFFAGADLLRMTAHLTDHGAAVILGSAVAAGWLMGLVSWLVTAARDTMGQVMIILLVTGAIAFLGLHHSIAGSVEVLMGVVAGEVTVASFARFLALATVGNAIGGIVLVAGLKFGHVSQA